MICHDINNTDNENEEKIYRFTDQELDSLALFFRQNLKELPEELECFSRFVEYYIYNKMTIAEAESFFLNKK